MQFFPESQVTPGVGMVLEDENEAILGHCGLVALTACMLEG